MRGLAAAALLALAWPAGAQAADLGGGTAPAGLRGYRAQLTLVSVRTAAKRSALVRAVVAARCGAGSIKARAPLAADGSFALRATTRDSAPEEPGLRRVAVVQVSGRIAGTTAGGTASTRIKLMRQGRVVERCQTAARTWQARAWTPETVAGLPRPNRGYFGLTNQTFSPHAFVLHVSASARRVQAAAFDYKFNCDSGRTPRKQNVTPGSTIGANGRFTLRERFTLRFSDATERYRVKVDGRFTPAGVNGMLSVTSVARSRSGAIVDRCRTGPLSFAGVL